MKPIRQQNGLSLIELMIAMTIGLVLLAGVVLTVTNSSRTQQEIERLGRQIENGRYAMQLFQEQVPHAGYYGEYYDIREPSSMPDPCSTNVSDIDDALGLPIQGYDSVSGNPSLTCLSDGEHRDGTDILVLRRASTSTTPIGGLTANEVYIQSLSINKVVAQAAGTEDAGSPGSFDLEKLDDTPANIRKLRTDIYFIGAGDDGVPTLKRKTMVADGTLGWQEELLATGIEQMQVEYGVDTDENGTAHDYDTDPSTVAEWTDVIAVKLHLVVRNERPTPGYTNAKTYDLGLEGTYDPPDDGYRRRAYVSAIRAANPSMRRE